MKAAVEHAFTGTTAAITGPYDATKTMLGSLLRQATGATTEDKYISSKASAIFNIPEIAIGSQHMPHVYKWSDNIYWIFAITNAGAAATRTITLTEFNSSNSTLSYRGYITLSGTTIASTKLARSLRAMVYKHTTGTVSTSGTSTTITGSSTGFQSERIAVGARIGFGTTDPTQVTTWYEITAINSDTELIINGAGVSLAASTSYVIEEIRLAIGINATSVLINGGIHLIKGLNYGTFVSGGTTIPEATTVDNIRASYLLKDAAIAGAATSTFTVTIASPGVFTINSHGLNNGDVLVFTTTGALPTGLTASPTTTLTPYFVINATANTFQVSTTLNGTAVNTSGSQSGTHTAHHYPSMAIGGLALDDFVSNTDHSIYLVSAVSTVATSIIKYNLRAALTMGAYAAITTGVTTSAYVLKTTTQATVQISTNNCARVFTVNHGPASGVKSVYFTGVSRIYRSAVSSITAGSTNYLSDAGMIEVPPGGTTTYTTFATMSQVDYSSTIDRMFIVNSGGRLGTYVATYNTTGDQFEKYIGANLSRLKLTTTPAGASDGLFPQAVLTLWTEDGWMFTIPSVTTSGQNWLWVWPFGADAYYSSTSNQYVITPKMATPGATKLYRVYVDHQEYAGTYGLGFPVETYRLWYRTSGIDDDSGAWTELSVASDLTAAAPGNYIQFRIAFDTMGEICVPTRIYSICCTYEDDSQDSHYLPSVTKSSTASKIFAWQQTVAWGSNIPNLQLELYDASTNLLIFSDDVTSSAYGTWQYSTDGTNWLAWDNTQDAVGNYIRYTATSFGYSGVTVRALLTQA